MRAPPGWAKLVTAATGFVGARAVGAACGLATQLLLARLLPADRIGPLFLAMSLGSVLGLVGALGYPGVVLPFLARYIRTGLPRLARAFVATALRDSVLLALAVSLATVLVVLVVTEDAGAARVLAIGALAAPALAASRTLGAVANTESRFTLAYLPDVLGRPLGLLVVVGLVALVFGAVPAVVVAAAFVGLATAQVALMMRYLRPAARSGPLPPARLRRLAAHWRRRGAPLVLSALVMSTFADVLVLVAGLFVGATDLAVYAVVVKLAYLAAFAVQVAQQLVLPAIAAAHAAKQQARLAGLLALGNRVALGLALAALAGGVLFGPSLLAAFGPAYTPGAEPLAILLLGLVFRAAAGPAMPILALYRRTSLPPILASLSLAVLVAASALLVPRFGLVGAALAALAAETAWSLSGAITGARIARQRIDVFRWRPAVPAEPS